MHLTRIEPSLLDHGYASSQQPLLEPRHVTRLVRRPRFTLDAYRVAAATLRAGTEANASHGPGSPCLEVRCGLGWCVDFAATAAVVLAGHAGAGSTTVALAIAEALAEGVSVQLLDCSEPLRCGLGPASLAELGTDKWGWRHGRRGDVDLVRPAITRRPTGPPRLNEPSCARPQVRVLDLGTTAASALPSRSAATAARAIDVVVVTRLTTPAVRQTEAVLGLLDRPVLVAAVGRYGRRRALPPLGPKLRRAVTAGLLVRVPWDRRLATAGLSGDPLPAAVARAGSALAGRLSLWTASTVGSELRPAAEPLS